MSETNGKKQLFKSIAPFWGARSNKIGEFYRSMEITPEIFDQIQKIEVGGKLMFRFTSEDTRSKSSAKQPVEAYLDYLTPQDVKEQKEFRAKASFPSSSRGAFNRQVSAAKQETKAPDDVL